MAFTDSAVRSIIDEVTSHAMALGVFERVNGHEPKQAPGGGLSCSIWVDSIGPVTSSGLAATSGRVVFHARITSNMMAEPQDGIDPEILAATSTLMEAYSGDFVLGGDARCVDLLGMHGTPLSAAAGYIQLGDKMFRAMEITLPVIINDMWDQVLTTFTDSGPASTGYLPLTGGNLTGIEVITVGDGVAFVAKNTSLDSTTGVFHNYAGNAIPGPPFPPPTPNTGSALAVTSESSAFSAMTLTGTELTRGTLKIKHVGWADGSDSGNASLSIDMQTAGTAAQGIFVTATTGATTGNLITLRNNSRDDFVVKGTGRVGITVGTGATPGGLLEIKQNDAASIGLYMKAFSAGALDMIQLQDTSGNLVFEVGPTGLTTHLQADGTVSVLLVKSGAAGTTTTAIQRIEGADNTKRVIDYRVTGDVTSRWRMDGDGTLRWGDGTTVDVDLYRSGASVLKTDAALAVGTVLGVGQAPPSAGLAVTGSGANTIGQFTTSTGSGSNTTGIVHAVGADVSNRAYVARVTGDAQGRFSAYADGTLQWGDGTNARDANLYRSAAGLLATDNSLDVVSQALGAVQPRSHGLIAWAYDPALIQSQTSATNGTVFLIRVDVARSANVTVIEWGVGAAATTATAGQNFVGLYNSAGTRLQTTGVDAQVTSTGLFATTITSQAVTPGFYWVGFVFNCSGATSTTSPYRSGNLNAGLVNVGLAAATARYATAGTGQTSLPGSITPSANTISQTTYWAAIK